MSSPHILRYGAITGVTAPCHQLRMYAHVVLLDGLLFTVAEVSPEGRAGVDNRAIDFSPSSSQFVAYQALVIPRYAGMHGSCNGYAPLDDVRYRVRASLITVDCNSSHSKQKGGGWLCSAEG